MANKYIMKASEMRGALLFGSVTCTNSPSFEPTEIVSKKKNTEIVSKKKTQIV